MSWFTENPIDWFLEQLTNWFASSPTDWWIPKIGATWDSMQALWDDPIAYWDAEENNNWQTPNPQSWYTEN